MNDLLKQAQQMQQQLMDAQQAAAAVRGRLGEGGARPADGGVRGALRSGAAVPPGGFGASGLRGRVPGADVPGGGVAGAAARPGSVPAAARAAAPAVLRGAPAP